jgi:predicted phosphoribosyltransferase
MFFRDGGEAGRKLTAAPDFWRGKKPLPGIPRGAVPMARVIAERLAGERDVISAR